MAALSVSEIEAIARSENIPFMWVARPGNSKTGPIPTAYVGRTVDEALASCQGCALLYLGECYAWSAMRRGFASTRKGYARDPERYTIESALRARHPAARAIRFGALGDPSRGGVKRIYHAARLARAEGLATIGYTHFWRQWRYRGLSRVLLASCNTLGEAREAVAKGWVASVIVPESTPGRIVKDSGNAYVICPAQTRKGTTCNDCRMCDPQHPVWSAGKVQGVAFLNHSPAARSRRLPTV